MSQYVPSRITPGKHFSIGVFKPDRGNAYAHATEGEVERRADGSVQTFSYEMPGARTVRVMLDGRNTEGNRAKALHTLATEMVARGWVEEGTTL